MVYLGLGFHPGGCREMRKEQGGKDIIKKIAEGQIMDQVYHKREMKVWEGYLKKSKVVLEPAENVLVWSERVMKGVVEQARWRDQRLVVSEVI